MPTIPPFIYAFAFSQHRRVASALTASFVSGEQTLDACVLRGAHTLGGTNAWLITVAERYIATFGGRTRPTYHAAERVVRAELWSIVYPATLKAAVGRPKAADAARKHLEALLAQLSVATWLTDDARMQPAPGAVSWNVPTIESTGALAEWLGISSDDLAWFDTPIARGDADTRFRSHHYHYRLIKKQSGGFRLIEAPQQRLKTIQRRILSGILERIPPYYNAAHGFVKGRSVRSFAAPHVDTCAVLRMDLRDFFPQIGRARVQAMFRTMGYPETVARTLSTLCTNIAPRSLFRLSANTPADSRAIYQAKQLYARPHLPQGAPTSPALANIAAYRLDCRLTGLADWAGATYTRYADDIAFSGDGKFARHAKRYSTEIAVIAALEGWSVQHRKTRIMHQSVRQHLAGVVVNKTLNVPRADFDRLKATLNNCIKHGSATQNRDGVPDFRAHLAGRVSWIKSVHLARGNRLQQLFDRIEW